MHSECLSEILKKTDYLVHLSIDGRIILKTDLKERSMRMWAGFNWLRVKSCGWLV
jgi:hypothetical protein